jgi:hypothetical protein
MGKHPDCPQHGGEGCDDDVVECWSPGGPCPEPNRPGCDTCGPCTFCTTADTAPPREVRLPIPAGQLAFRVVASHDEAGVTVIDSVDHVSVSMGSRSCTMCGKDEGDGVGIIIDGVCGDCRRAWA